MYRSPGQQPRSAALLRNRGMVRLSALTVGIGAVSVLGSLGIANALPGRQHGTSASHPNGSANSGSGGTGGGATGHAPAGSSNGTGSADGGTDGGTGGGSQPLQPPANPPSSGSSRPHATSGAS